MEAFEPRQEHARLIGSRPLRQAELIRCTGDVTPFVDLGRIQRINLAVATRIRWDESHAREIGNEAALHALSSCSGISSFGTLIASALTADDGKTLDARHLTYC